MIRFLLIMCASFGLSTWNMFVIRDSILRHTLLPYYLIALILVIVAISALLYDIITGRTKTVRGQIMTLQGRTIHVRTEQNKMKKYRILNREVYNRLLQDQAVEIQLTFLTNFTASVTILSEDHISQSK